MHAALDFESALLELFSCKKLPDRTFRIEATLARGQRTTAIHRILDQRFFLHAIEELQQKDYEWWDSTRSRFGRAVYAEALREWRRLEAASDDDILAELAALARSP